MRVQKHVIWGKFGHRLEVVNFGSTSLVLRVFENSGCISLPVSSSHVLTAGSSRAGTEAYLIFNSRAPPMVVTVRLTDDFFHDTLLVHSTAECFLGPISLRGGPRALCGGAELVWSVMVGVG